MIVAEQSEEVHWESVCVSVLNEWSSVEVMFGAVYEEMLYCVSWVCRAMLAERGWSFFKNVSMC